MGRGDEVINQHPEDLSEVLSLIPDWLAEMLEDGQVLVLPRGDWASLDWRVQRRMEVLSY